MDGSTIRRRGLSDRALARVVSYVEEHIGDDMTLDTLARIACVSRFHFARMFRLSIGTSPMAYVKHRRVEFAKRLLGRGERPISHIAFELGFCDQSHFTRVFRDRTGITPGYFARMHSAPAFAS